MLGSEQERQYVMDRETQTRPTVNMNYVTAERAGSCCASYVKRAWQSLVWRLRKVKYAFCKLTLACVIHVSTCRGSPNDVEPRNGSIQSSVRRPFAAFPAQDRTSLPLQHHHQTHYPQHDLLQPWVFAQQDRDVSDKRDETGNAANDIFFAVQERLASRVKLGVICHIVVTFGEEAEGCFTAAKSAEMFYYNQLPSSVRKPSALLALKTSGSIMSDIKDKLTLHHIS
jgi:hypothetical protein